MARLDDLMDFARAHGLKIGTIRDLIAYRLKKDHMVERVATSAFTASSGAQWQAQVFRDKASGEEQLALVHGTLDPAQPGAGPDAQPRPVRRRARRGRAALGRCSRARCAMIEEEGSGVVVALHAAAPGSLSRAIDLALGQAGRGRRCGARLRHRRADPRRARHPRHDPA